MADKEVQNLKNSSVSADIQVPASKNVSKTQGKSTSSVSSKPKIDVESTSNAKMREILEILRVMNGNVNAQNERLDKQEKRLDDMCSYWDDGVSDYNDYQSEESPDVEPQVESENSSEPRSIFRQLSDKFKHSEQVDPETHPDLASLVNNSFRNGLSDDNLDEICKNIKRPDNCDSLVKTRVNQGIWRLLKPHTQAEDSRLSAIQGVLLKASTNIVKLVERLGETESEHVELGTTAIALLGHANKMINTKRKDLHKSDLDYKYHYLASASLPYTDLLYGNDSDVNNNVREINNMNRIGRAVSRGGGPIRRGQGQFRRGFNPYANRGRGARGRGRGFFPGRPEMAAKNARPPVQKK